MHKLYIGTGYVDMSAALLVFGDLTVSHYFLFPTSKQTASQESLTDVNSDSASHFWTHNLS